MMKEQWLREGTLVYALAEETSHRGRALARPTHVNRWSARVDPGVVSGNRTSDAQLTQVAARMEKAAEMEDVVRNLLGMLDTPIMQRKMKDSIFLEVVQDAKDIIAYFNHVDHVIEGKVSE